MEQKTIFLISLQLPKGTWKEKNGRSRLILIYKECLFRVEEGPIVLDHVLAPILTDGVWVVFFVFVGVAINFGDIDVAFVVAFDEDILRPHFPQGSLDIGDDVA